MLEKLSLITPIFEILFKTAEETYQNLCFNFHFCLTVDLVRLSLVSITDKIYIKQVTSFQETNAKILFLDLFGQTFEMTEL